MAGLFALSINSENYQGNFLDDIFWQTFYQQHLGEEYAGLATYDGKRIKIRTHRGLFRSTFSEDLKGLEGTEGIGYCGSAREPYFTDSRLGKFSLCCSGNIINLSKLVKRFKNLGQTFERGDDVEVIAKLIVQEERIVDGIKRMTEEVEGAYSILLLTSEGIYAVRSPSGHWPLVIGEKKGAVAVASDTGGFGNFGFKRVRDLKPGEIVLIKNGEWKQVGRISFEKVQICSFWWVYTAFANGVFEGIPVSLVRKRLGATLARRDIEKGFIPHIVAPIPDSGRFHAIGYHQEFCRQMMLGRINRVPLYDEVLLKYGYAGRSFTPQTQEARDREAFVKILSSGESLENLLEAFEPLVGLSGRQLKNLILVICDDSIVRGTQIQTNLVPKLKALGIDDIHFRISNPELRSHCLWGKTTRKGETLASRLPKKEDRIRSLGIKSLEYNRIEDLIQAIGLPQEQLCVDCVLETAK